MKSMGHPSFFRVFDLLLSTTNRGLKQTRWSHDGVEFERERHSFTGARHGLTIEIFDLTCARPRGWSLIVTKEYWWAGLESRALKNLRWARLLSGERKDALDWMRRQESALNKSLPRAAIGAAPATTAASGAKRAELSVSEQESDV
jgi:hypothetical protein